MTAATKMKLLGGIVWNLNQWLLLRQWARRNGDQIAEANASRWIEDCRARGQRISQLPVCDELKEAA